MKSIIWKTRSGFSGKNDGVLRVEELATVQTERWGLYALSLSKRY
jgi:hypothetical protein